MSNFSKIIKNTGFVLIATILRMVSSLVLVLLVARYLGSTGMGKFSVVLSLFWLFQKMATMGLEPITIREVAKDKSLGTRYLSNGVLIGTLSSFLMIIVMYIFANVANYSHDVVLGTYIMGVALILTTVNLIFRSIYIAFERAEYILFSDFSETILKLIFGIVVLSLGYGLISVIIVIAFSQLVRLSINIYVTSRYLFKIQFKIDTKLCRWLLRTMPAFAGTQIINGFSGNITVIILSLLMGMELVGYYSAAMRLIGSFRLILQSYKSAIQPVAARIYNTSIVKLRSFCMESIRYILMLTIPVCAGTLILAERIVVLLFTDEFVTSGRILQFLVWILILYGASMVFTSILIASNNQRVNFRIIGISLIARILLALVLIPVFSYYGAAVAVLISNLVNFSQKYYFINKKYFKIPLFEISWKILVSCLPMIVFLISFPGLNIFLLIFLSSIIYLIFLLIFGEIDLRVIGLSSVKTFIKR